MAEMTIDQIKEKLKFLERAKETGSKIFRNQINSSHRDFNELANEIQAAGIPLEDGYRDSEAAYLSVVEKRINVRKKYYQDLLKKMGPKPDMNNTSTHTTINQPKQPEFQTLLGEQELLDVIDEVTGTQTVTVKGENGNRMRKISRLPRTEQEEQYYKQGENLIDGINQVGVGGQALSLPVITRPSCGR